MIRSQLHLIGQPVRSLQTMLRTISFAYPSSPSHAGRNFRRTHPRGRHALFRGIFPSGHRTGKPGHLGRYRFLCITRWFPPHSAAHPQLSKSRVFRHWVRPAFILTWCSPCSAGCLGS